jgi:hypothetical protein
MAMKGHGDGGTKVENAETTRREARRIMEELNRREGTGSVVLQPHTGPARRRNKKKEKDRTKRRRNGREIRAVNKGRE